jgi:phosphoglycerol transferase MdoB-like AlkP superfamily enzyme
MNIETIDYHGSSPNLVVKEKEVCNKVILPITEPLKPWYNFYKKMSEHYKKMKILHNP